MKGYKRKLLEWEAVRKERVEADFRRWEEKEREFQRVFQRNLRYIEAEKLRVEKKYNKEISRIKALEDSRTSRMTAREGILDRKKARRLNGERRALEKKRIKRAKRRAKEHAAPGRISNGLSSKLLESQQGKCIYCKGALGDSYELDHIMPLALGGTNEDSNIQLLCRTCNISKGHSHPIEYARKLGRLV